jgi:hypothetical protein
MRRHAVRHPQIAIYREPRNRIVIHRARSLEAWHSRSGSRGRAVVKKPRARFRELLEWLRGA